MNIDMFKEVGDFGEDKDAAAKLRVEKVAPCVARKEVITLDFGDVTLVTQSFIHALISDVLRVHGEEALEYLEFKSCADVVKGIIGTVVQYSLDSMDDDENSAE
jgi:STAS-like domain of unknown function (DUF4325)